MKKISILSIFIILSITIVSSIRLKQHQKSSPNKVPLGFSLEQTRLIEKLQTLSEDDFRELVCDKFGKNGFASIKCAPKDLNELALMGNTYLNKFGKPNLKGPVILIPGLGGSALEAQISKTSAVHWWCWKNDDWFRLWMPISSLFSQDCWFDNWKIEYNESANNFEFPPGVDCRAMDFGGLKGIAQLDTWFGFPVPLTSYYASMIASLEAVGYVPGQTLFGAPYDWRFPTTHHELTDLGFFPQIQQLVEDIVEANGKKVYIISHSLGGPTTLAFFEWVGPTWVEEHIAGFLPIAAPWAGTAKALRTVISGDDLGMNVNGISLLSKERVAEMAKTLGGLIQQMPTSFYWNETRVFVTKGDSKYTASQFQQLFNDMGYPTTSTIVNHTQGVLAKFQPPRVPTWCMYGTNTPTEISYTYNDFSSQPIIDYTDMGDGTINLESLQECHEWQNSQSAPVEIKEFALKDHNGILEDQGLFDYIISILSAPEEKENGEKEGM